MTIFSSNMKKYRMEKSLTQEQVAAILNVNPQTVSRWECGTTLPDVLMLPEIAKLYAVTIDDLYKNTKSAYRNYAERLGAVYEKTKNVEDFYNAYIEYGKLIKSGKMEMADMWEFASLMDEMREFCTDKALEWFDRTIAEGRDKDAYSYDRARSLRAGLSFSIGKSEELIPNQEEIVKASISPKEYAFLMELYCRAERYNDTTELFEIAIKKGITDWTIYYYAAEAHRFLGNYETAIKLYEKAGALGTDFHDEIEGIAYCYEKMGEKELAYNKLMDLAQMFRGDGYDEDALIYEQMADAIK